MNARTDPKTREARASSVDVHALLREILLDKKASIIAAGQQVSLELNARRPHVKGERDTLREFLDHGLDTLLTGAAQGTRLVVGTVTIDHRVKLRMVCGERSFETELSTFINTDPPAPSPLVVAPSAPVLAGTRTVLVVDDDIDTVALLRRVLERRGYEVLGATSLAEALMVAGTQSFDVLISDVGLPDGSGVELMDRLGRPHHAIALTGVSSEEDIARIRAAGFRQHLTKPVSLTTLESAISELLKSA
ncbi:response regulator [Pendulispora brunnea]|uniref:Response regulator n=1 Tax=Pendulispora brunnea TaxID=2905690 RepID=A0ABZ2KE60_9BACT